jgi:hypothetical protein
MLWTKSVITLPSDAKLSPMWTVRCRCIDVASCARQTLMGLQLPTEPQTCSIIFSGSCESDYLIFIYATCLYNSRTRELNKIGLERKMLRKRLRNTMSHMLLLEMDEWRNYLSVDEETCRANSEHEQQSYAEVPGFCSHCYKHFRLRYRGSGENIFRLSLRLIHGARRSVVGWGTMLQADRSRVQVPDEVIGFFSIDLILPTALWPGVDSASNRNEYQEYSWG